MTEGRGREKIIFAHSSDELYGADRIVLDLYGALTREERSRTEIWLPTDVSHAEHLLCKELESRGARVRHVELPIMRRAYGNPGALLSVFRRMLRAGGLVRDARPAVVYCTTSATFLMAPVARFLRVPMVVGHKQEMWSHGDGALLSIIGRACHRLIAISQPVLDDLGPSLRRRASLVLNATSEPPAYRDLAERSGPLTYTVASRWNHWKGHRTLLAAWDLADSPGRLVILGGRPPSGAAVPVESLVAALRTPASVDVIGEVADIGPYLDATDVVVVPSDEPEPFGLVAVEAFARGRPVIGSDAGGLADIITHHHDGWTFPRSDALALAALLGSLERRDVNQAGRAARAAYEARFTEERYAAEWRSAAGLPPVRLAVAVRKSKLLSVQRISATDAHNGIPCGPFDSFIPGEPSS